MRTSPRCTHPRREQRGEEHHQAETSRDSGALDENQQRGKWRSHPRWSLGVSTERATHEEEPEEKAEAPTASFSRRFDVKKCGPRLCDGSSSSVRAAMARRSHASTHVRPLQTLRHLFRGSGSRGISQNQFGGNLIFPALRIR